MIRICARNLQNVTLRRSVLNASVVSRGFCEKIEKNETEPAADNKLEEKKLSGFAKAYEKHSAPHLDQKYVVEPLPDLPFATLLKNSKFIDVSYRTSCNFKSS